MSPLYNKFFARKEVPASNTAASALTTMTVTGAAAAATTAEMIAIDNPMQRTHK